MSGVVRRIACWVPAMLGLALGARWLVDAGARYGPHGYLGCSYESFLQDAAAGCCIVFLSVVISLVASRVADRRFRAGALVILTAMLLAIPAAGAYSVARLPDIGKAAAKGEYWIVRFWLAVGRSVAARGWGHILQVAYCCWHV